MMTIGELLKEVSVIGDSSEKVCRLDGLVKGLEDEMRKIDAFKRELPLCMLLLNDAIVLLKEEMVQYREESRKQKPVLEEFIPLKKNGDSDDEVHRRGKLDHLDGSVIKMEPDCVDKKNWMRSVQLWSANDEHHQCRSSDHLLFDSKQDRNFYSKENTTGYEYINADRNRTAASSFMSFKASDGLSRREANTKPDDLPVPGLSLFTPGAKSLREESESRTNWGRSVLSSSAPNSQSNLRYAPPVLPPHLQTSRKQRRCWSPELHRRFVNALQQLGGCQAATPKLIRELMQIDGLTNDEVKSHLQKYRDHTRRMPPAAATTSANQSSVVLGGLCMSQDTHGATSRGASSQSGSPQGPLDLTGNTGAGISTTGGDNMEDDEDTKSEGYSWKRHNNKVDV